MIPKPKIAVTFFGITRSLRYTIESIRKNILKPAHEYGDVSIYGHFFRLERIENVRSGEKGVIDPEEHKLLHADWVQFSEPDTILSSCYFDEIKSFGDHWNDGFRSMSNLIHQLYSLKTVTVRALEDDPDIVIFCRPDLEYHDSFLEGLRKATAAETPTILLPFWQRHKGGLNDRFSICVGEKAATAYGARLDMALPFCRNLNIEIHSERLIRYAVVQSGVSARILDVRASRVRADGRRVGEDFSKSSWKMFRNDMRFRRMMCH